MPFLPPNQQRQSTEGTKTEHKSATQKKKVNRNTVSFTKVQSPVSEREHHVKNGDEIDESHKSQLKCEN